MKLSKEEILSFLPHRPPFLFVDKAEVSFDLENPVGTTVSAELYVDPSLELFKGHFPSFPVFPGVLQIEALAQACCLSFAPFKKDQQPIFYLLQVQNFKFKNMVKPKDTFTMKTELINKKDKVVIFKVEGSCDNVIVCSGEIWGVIEEKSL